MKGKYWMVLFALIVGASVSPVRCCAEIQCPWLNAATASGVLGGEVKMTVPALTPQGDTTCYFERVQGGFTSSLRIAVNTMQLPARDFAAFLAQCAGTATPLKGIGNEAIQCVARKSDAGAEQVIGRVRDRAFVIDLKRNPAVPLTSPKGLSDEARNVAEQVAGALF